MTKLTSILLVDDDSTTNFLNKLLLNRLGVAERLLVTENGQEALAALAQHFPGASGPALILLDINMPVMNGIEFLKAYQRLPLPQRQHTVVVLLTTSVNPHDLARAQAMPIAGSLAKPLTESKITALLTQHFPALPTGYLPGPATNQNL